MMPTKTTSQRKFMSLGLLLLGICLFSLPAQGAELTNPLTTTSWISRWASWGAQTVKNTAVKLAAFAAPFVISQSAEIASNTLFPADPRDKKRTRQNGCVRLAANVILLGGICKFLQKGLPYLTGDAEKPFAYYATLFPMLYFGSKAAASSKAYWDASLASSTLPLFSWSNLGRMARATGVLLGSFWVASHMPLLVKSFFFDTPVPYFSFEHVASFFLMGRFHNHAENLTSSFFSENPDLPRNPYLKSFLKRLPAKVA